MRRMRRPRDRVALRCDCCCLCFPFFAFRKSSTLNGGPIDVLSVKECEEGEDDGHVVVDYDGVLRLT